MKIAVLSDTHIPGAARALPEKVTEILQTADAVIHAGDYQDISVVEYLQAVTELYGVYGNMDSFDIRSAMPEKRIVKLEGCSIGVLHGGGSPRGLEDRILAAFQGEKVDAIVYGHSHQPANHMKNGILLFNPGSPTDKRYAPYNSMGMLTIDGAVSGEIIKIE